MTVDKDVVCALLVNKGFSVERLTDPQVIADPYPYYDLLRAQSPVFGYRDFPPGTVPGVDEPEPSWAVLNFDQVQQVARDHDSFLVSRQPAGSILCAIADAGQPRSARAHTAAQNRVRRIPAELYPRIVG